MSEFSILWRMLFTINSRILYDIGIKKKERNLSTLFTVWYRIVLYKQFEFQYVRMQHSLANVIYDKRNEYYRFHGLVLQKNLSDIYIYVKDETEFRKKISITRDFFSFSACFFTHSFTLSLNNFSPRLCTS